MKPFTLVLLVSALSISSAFAQSDCDTGTYGTVTSRCKIVDDGNLENEAFLNVADIDLCLKQYNSTTQYVLGDISGTYAGDKESKDPVFPGAGAASEDPYGRSKAYSTYKPGDEFAQHLLFAFTSDYDHVSQEGSTLTLKTKSDMDGEYGNYHSYRAIVRYNSETKSGELAYEREYPVFNWKPIVHFSFKCK